ncbi:hypothetical protein E2C01_006238 [Portunus trituberculatus]|uniref:Uncharacterized protein n=1 Tax=Portunus trituberculatus TaxID=210409 RepID=A0A5B7CVT2_PORTR|nr:hypothetical protein [Portunus trituberculatus]
MRPGKDEGEGDLKSDHLLHAGDGLLKGVMVPLRKGLWANLNNSENYKLLNSYDGSMEAVYRAWRVAVSHGSGTATCFY